MEQFKTSDFPKNQTENITSESTLTKMSPQLVNWLRRNLEPNQFAGLRMSLSNLKRGSAPTKSFKLYGRTDKSLFEGFLSTIPSGFEWPAGLLKYELHKLEKFGPQGGVPSWEDVKDNFLMYYTRPVHIKRLPSKHVNKYKCLNAVKLDHEKTLAYLIHTDKIKARSSGWPTFNLKKTSPDAQHIALALDSNGEWKLGYGYVFTRLNKRKPRIFFPMPFSSMINEAAYYAPFLAAIQKDLRIKRHKSLYTFWADKIGFQQMYDTIVNPIIKDYRQAYLGKYGREITDDEFVFVAFDAEKFDTTMGLDQTLSSFVPKVKAALKLSDQQEAQLIDYLTFSATCPIITPDGMYSGYRGKASGAETTNGDETCFNEDVQQLILDYIHCYSHFPVHCVYNGGNGDDGLFIFHVPKTQYFKDQTYLEKLKAFEHVVKNAADFAAKRSGLIIQSAKWDVSNIHGQYCQRFLWFDKYTHELRHCYPLSLCLNSIVNPESGYTPATWDKDYRDLDIIEKLDNCYGHPLWAYFVMWVDKGLKYPLLGLTEDETSRILSKWNKWAETHKSENWNKEADFTPSTSPTIRLILNLRRLFWASIE